MSHRIPDDAFAFYVALGPDRSYQRVADHFGVSKNGILKAAAREEWGERLAAIEESVRERIDEKLGESLEEMHVRHLKLLRAMAGRVARALQQYELTSAMEAMRAADMTIKLERLVAGEVSERRGVSVEEVTRREIDQLLVSESDGEAAATED